MMAIHKLDAINGTHVHARFRNTVGGVMPQASSAPDATSLIGTIQVDCYQNDEFERPECKRVK
jgi:hypothetical protein